MVNPHVNGSEVPAVSPGEEVQGNILGDQQLGKEREEKEHL